MIEDASFIWWFIRPATHYPTIELRICDSCTRLDDVVIDRGPYIKRSCEHCLDVLILTTA